MKLTDIIKVVAQELGTSDIKEINKLLKAEPGIKFRITGKALGHFGFTGQIKALTEEGVKAFMTNKVSLIRLSDIENFEKAKPRVERPVRTKSAEDTSPAKPSKGAAPKVKAAVKAKIEDLDDEDDDDFDGEDFESDENFEEDLRPKKLKPNKSKPAGKSGSKFIPKMKK